LAFTTTTGENGTDYIGSEGVDALFVLNDNSGKILVDALGGGDNVDLTNETGVIGNAEVKLGEGNDIFTTGVNDTNNNRLKDSTVNGGPGNDDLTTEGTIGTKLRGNEGDDDFFIVSNYTNTTLNGNAGNDSFTIDSDGNLTAAGIEAVTLSDSKLLGGSGNDGQMDFTNGTILAVDSVIQGGKGLDTITIGDVTAGTSNFRVSGGADNDTINVDNTVADGVNYNGAAGEDEINFRAASTADAITKGGDGNDRFNILGSGDIAALGEAGDDTFTINNGGTESTLTGGEGADSYTMTTADDTTFVFNAVSESAAATSGTTVTFDTFNSSVLNSNSGVAGTILNDVIDLSTGGTGEALVGNRLVNNNEVLENANILSEDVATFAALKSNLDNGGTLVASNSNVDTDGDGVGNNVGQISLQLIEIDAGVDNTLQGIDGWYAILNNTNQIVDGGDMMFKLATVVGDGAGGASDNILAAQDEMLQLQAAIEAGF
jgi:hypothetical protein